MKGYTLSVPFVKTMLVLLLVCRDLRAVIKDYGWLTEMLDRPV